MLVEFEKLCEIEELALGGLRPQVGFAATTWTNAGLEHEVEGHWRVDIAASGRVLDLVFLDEFA